MKTKIQFCIIFLLWAVNCYADISLGAHLGFSYPLHPLADQPKKYEPNIGQLAGIILSYQKSKKVNTEKISIYEFALELNLFNLHYSNESNSYNEQILYYLQTALFLKSPLYFGEKYFLLFDFGLFCDYFKSDPYTLIINEGYDLGLAIGLDNVFLSSQIPITVGIKYYMPYVNYSYYDYGNQRFLRNPRILITIGFRFSL